MFELRVCAGFWIYFLVTLLQIKHVIIRQTICGVSFQNSADCGEGYAQDCEKLAHRATSKRYHNLLPANNRFQTIGYSTGT